MDAALIPVLAAALAASAVLLLGLGLLGRASGGGRSRRLRRGLGLPEEGGRSSAEGLRRGLAHAIGELGRSLGPKDEAELSKNRLALVRAGLRGPNAALVFQGVKAALAVVPAGIFLLAAFSGALTLTLPATMLGAVALASLGCFAPNWWLHTRTTARKIAFTDELPDALDLLVVCVESGMGLDQAIHRVSEEMVLSGPTVSRELGQITLELRAGKQRQEALRSLARRVGIEDVNSLCTLLIQADVFGISVARTLRVYSDTLRTKRYQRAEEKAAKLPVKLLLPLIFCILPALFVAIMGPAGLKLMDVFTRLGH